jgi:methoxymalonate biosynthesis acyl carrier protein
MTTEQTFGFAPASTDVITDVLVSFLTQRLKTEVAPDQELFKSGLVSSMFAMELVVHLEASYDIAITGPELKLDNFRTIQAMTSLVERLRGAEDLGAEGTGEDG